MIPTFLSNRIRIEKMTWVNAKRVIEGPCEVFGIKVEEGLAEAILAKLFPESAEEELTYLQVLLDKIYKIALENAQHPPSNIQRCFSAAHMKTRPPKWVMDTELTLHLNY